MTKVEQMAQDTNAQFWIEHDLALFKKFEITPLKMTKN